MKVVQWLKDYAKESNMKKAIIGISGGKDSTVVAMLLVKALGKENVIGVLMPNGNQKDIQDSLTVVNTLGIPHFTINIEDSYRGILSHCNASLKVRKNAVSEDARTNIAPRLRMIVLYTLGQTLNARVVGTGNLSERTVGYFTKWGDGACDFNPVGNLTSLEVVELGKELAKEFGISESLIVKVPHDGLGDLSDEDKLGVTYAEIHDYIRNDGKNLSKETYDLIKSKEKMNKHKLIPIPMY